MTMAGMDGIMFIAKYKHGVGEFGNHGPSTPVKEDMVLTFIPVHSCSYGFY